MYIYPLHVLSTENVDTQENDQTYVLLQYLIQVLLLVGLRMLENNQVEPVFIVVPSCNSSLIIGGDWNVLLNYNRDTINYLHKHNEKSHQ
jgi:hypothetical protein